MPLTAHPSRKVREEREKSDLSESSRCRKDHSPGTAPGRCELQARGGRGRRSREVKTRLYIQPLEARP